MSNDRFSWDLFNKAPIVGIVRGYDETIVSKIADSFLASGLTTIEVTMNTDNATKIIGNLRQKHSNLNIGAGTVCNIEDLDQALSAGSQFIVTPIINEAVIEKCVSKNIPVFPGAYTPSEIYKAYSLGASAVKVFPATQLGTQYIKDVLAPLDKVKLLPTGGVTKENIKSFFEVGSIGVGMGSSLLNKTYINTGDFNKLITHFNEIKEEINDFII